MLSAAIARANAVSTWRILLVLFLASLVLRGAYLTVGPGASRPFEGDEGSYHGYAESFVSGDGWQNGGVLSERPPFISFLLVVPYLLAEPDAAVGRWTMVVVSSLVAPLLFLVARQLLGRDSPAPLLAASAWVLYPPSVFYVGFIWTENTSAFLVLAALGTFIWAARRGSTLSALGVGAVLALAPLNRSTYLFLPVGLLIAQLVLARLGPIDLRWSWKMWAAGLGGFVLVMAPWTIRNFVEHGTFMPTTSRLGYGLVLTNGTLEDPHIQQGMYYKNFAYLDQGNEMSERERDALLRGFAYDELRRNWTLLPRPVLNRAKNFWTWRPDPYDPNWTRNDTLMTLIWVPTLLLLVAGGFLRSWRNTWPAIAVVLYAFVMTLPFWGTPRFRYPVDPIIIMGASVGFVALMRIAQQRFEEVRAKRLSRGRAG